MDIVTGTVVSSDPGRHQIVIRSAACLAMGQISKGAAQADDVVSGDMRGLGAHVFLNETRRCWLHVDIGSIQPRASPANLVHYASGPENLPCSPSTCP